MSATAWLIIATLFIAAFGTYMMLAKETGFKIFAPSDGKSRFEWLNKLFDSSKPSDKKGLLASKWEDWKNKDLENRRWGLYIALAVVTIFVAYLVPEEYGSFRYKIMGGIVLIGLHLVIWPFFTDKTSAVTKFLVSAFLIFCVVAFLFPNTADITWKSVKNQATDFDNNYGKPSASGSAQQSAIVPAVYQPQTQTLQVVPGGGFRKVSIPPGRILKDLTWDCPNGCILEIVHDGQPVCPTTNIYQGLPCGMLPVEVGRSGVPRYREQFVTPYGHFINFPRDIVVVGVAFGTDAVLGPIEVTATITL